MPSTLSLRKHNINLNEWAFSFTANDRKKLEKSVSNLKSVHYNIISSSRIVEDPDVLGYYMFCGICEKEEDMNLVLLFMENQFHEEVIYDMGYDEETGED